MKKTHGLIGRAWQRGKAWGERWKEPLKPWVLPVLTRVSPYHRAFARRFPTQLPPARPVTVVGNITCANGVGEVARGSLRALRAVGHDASYVDMPCHQPTPRSDWPPETPLPAGRRVNLVHMNAKDTRWAYRAVGYRVVELEREISVYAAGTEWAEPDVEQAAAAMQQIVADPQRAHALGQQAAQDIRRDYSAEVVARAMLDRMRLVMHQQKTRG